MKVTLITPPDNMLIPGTTSLQFPIGAYELISESRGYYTIANENGLQIRLSKKRFAPTTATIHVDDQPETFDTSIPNMSPFCLIVAWSSVIESPRYYTTEGEAVINYDIEVKKHRDILSANSQYKFNVSLFSGSTLLRKTSK